MDSYDTSQHGPYSVASTGLVGSITHRSQAPVKLVQHGMRLMRSSPSADAAGKAGDADAARDIDGSRKLRSGAGEVEDGRITHAQSIGLSANGHVDPATVDCDDCIRGTKERCGNDRTLGCPDRQARRPRIRGAPGGVARVPKPGESGLIGCSFHW